MVKGNDIIGKPIVTRADGKIVEKVHDIVFDAITGKVLALLVEEGGLFASAKVLPFSKIASIGEDAVMTDAESAIIPADQDQHVKKVLDSHRAVNGLKVMTESGSDLGKILDVYFDEQTGHVIGYEVSGGIFADAYSGRSFLPAPHTLRIGQDVVIVPDATEQLMEEQVGGVKGMAQQAGKTLNDVKESAQRQASEYGEAARQRGSEVSEQARAKTMDVWQRADELVQQRSADYAIGRRAGTEVRSSDGLLLVAPGQIVTEAIYKEAESQGKQRELLASVLSSQSEDWRNQAQQWAGTATDQVSKGIDEVKSFAKDTWEQLSGKASELKDQTAAQIEERRIRGALGRPVNRVILDKEDHVILDKGEMITNQAIQTAREAGVLDMLLDSVGDGAKFGDRMKKVTSH